MFVATPGGRGVFDCFSPTGERFISVRWLVNGSSIHNADTIVAHFFNGSGSGSLEFSDVPVIYNGTTVQCQAQLGTEVLSSGISRLLVQGVFSNHKNIIIIINNLQVSFLLLDYYFWRLIVPISA